MGLAPAIESHDDVPLKSVQGDCLRPSRGGAGTRRSSLTAHKLALKPLITESHVVFDDRLGRINKVNDIVHNGDSRIPGYPRSSWTGFDVFLSGERKTSKPALVTRCHTVDSLSEAGLKM